MYAVPLDGHRAGEEVVMAPAVSTAPADARSAATTRSPRRAETAGGRRPRRGAPLRPPASPLRARCMLRRCGPAPRSDELAVDAPGSVEYEGPVRPDEP